VTYLLKIANFPTAVLIGAPLPTFPAGVHDQVIHQEAKSHGAILQWRPHDCSTHNEPQTKMMKFCIF